MYILRPQYPPPRRATIALFGPDSPNQHFIILQQDMNHDRYLVPHMYYRPRVYFLFGVSHFELGWFSRENEDPTVQTHHRGITHTQPFRALLSLFFRGFFYLLSPSGGINAMPSALSLPSCPLPNTPAALLALTCCRSSARTTLFFHRAGTGR